MSKEAEKFVTDWAFKNRKESIEYAEVMQAYADHCVMVALEKDEALSTAYLLGYNDAKKAERERIVMKLEEQIRFPASRHREEIFNSPIARVAIRKAIKIVNDETRGT